MYYSDMHLYYCLNKEDLVYFPYVIFSSFQILIVIFISYNILIHEYLADAVENQNPSGFQKLQNIIIAKANPF